MKSLENFCLLVSFEPNPADWEFDEGCAAELPPMLAAVRRLKHEYLYSIVTMKAGDREDELELAYDIAYVLPQISDWLEQLVTQDGRATLGFAAQGSERYLMTERHGDRIVYWFRPFFSDPEVGMRAQVLANRFFNEWIDFIEKLLDILVNLQSDLISDSEFRKLATSIHKIRSAIR
jgi:hypothetical protein